MLSLVNELELFQKAGRGWAFINHRPAEWPCSPLTMENVDNPKTGLCQIIEGMDEAGSLSFSLVAPNTSYSLQEVAVKIIKSRICRQQYQYLFLKDQKKFIGKDMLCASWKWGVESCQVRSVWPGAGRGLQGSRLPFNLAQGDHIKPPFPGHPLG